MTALDSLDDLANATNLIRNLIQHHKVEAGGVRHLDEFVAGGIVALLDLVTAELHGWHEEDEDTYLKHHNPALMKELDNMRMDHCRARSEALKKYGII